MKIIFIVSLLILIIGFPAFSQNGVIRELTGDVALRPAGTEGFIPAAVGAEVAQDTIVSTGFRSSAVITVGSSTITVRPLTRLSLSEIQRYEESENINLNLQAGRVRVDVNPPAGARTIFTVRTLYATASVRGTNFEVDARNLQVIEGRVIFSGANGFETAVSAGASGSIASGGSAQDPEQIAAAELSPPAPAGAENQGAAGSPQTTGSSPGFVGVSPEW